MDICQKCGNEFGDSGQDANGWNCTCVHCGCTAYDRVDENGDPVEEEEGGEA